MEETDSLRGNLVSSTINKNDMGCTVEESVYDNLHVETYITAPAIPYIWDYEQQAAHMNKAAEFHRNLAVSSDPKPDWNCDNREPSGTPWSSMAFLPVIAADLSPDHPKDTYSGKCFEEITFEYVPVSKTKFEVNVTTKKPKGPFCSDVLFFANTELAHTHMFYHHGTHKLTFDMPTSDEQADFDFNGIHAFAFCDGLIPTVGSMWNFFKSMFGGCEMGPCKPNLPFIGKKVPKYMEEATVDFLESSMGIKMEKRDITRVHIDKNSIKSGDFFAVNRLTGGSQLIAYGTGSHISHCTMAIWMDDGELYVVESTAGAYYPDDVVQGIMKTKWDEWIQFQDDTSCQVMHLPLKKELSEKFDRDAAQAYFDAHEGLPYGYHNFLYGWIDTPEGDWPPLLPRSFAPILFSIVEKFSPKTAFNFYTEAMNKRMGFDTPDTVKNITELAVIAAGQNKTLDDIMAMVEVDGWEYFGEGPRDGESMVCSVFVTAMYRAAGLFGDMEINATEQHPLDVYSLNFYDTEVERPQQCIDADPNLPYCQLTGNYRIDITDYYSTLEPYPHMSETCAVHWPVYNRDPGC